VVRIAARWQLALDTSAKSTCNNCGPKPALFTESKLLISKLSARCARNDPKGRPMYELTEQGFCSLKLWTK
jgi:hypothetical protein